MIYCFVCTDGPNAALLRMKHLDEHLKHIQDNIDHFPVAGPIPDGKGGMTGSMVMIDAETEDDAWEVFKQDPYAQVDIWESVPGDAVQCCGWHLAGWCHLGEKIGSFDLPFFLYAGNHA